MTEPTRYPLAWPLGQPRAKRRRTSRYSVPFTTARDDLLEELRLMHVRSIVLSSNVELRRDGLPYANRPEPADPGVAVYWVRSGKGQVCVACDTFTKVRCNLRAVGITVRAFRDIERAGASDLLDRAYQGFMRLPASTSGLVSRPRTAVPVEPWWETLGVSEKERDPVVVKKAYVRLSRAAHPDRGGSTEAQQRLNAAYEIALFMQEAK